MAEFLTPVLKESKFQETGVITPEEFVAAGDHLVHHCPSWQWAGGSSDCVRDYLPPEKQFLITRNVPCYKRCRQMEYRGELEKVLDSEDPEGGWVDTHHFQETDPSALALTVKEMVLEEPTVTEQSDSDAEEAIDMEEFVESGMLEEDSATIETVQVVTDEDDHKDQSDLLPRRSPTHPEERFFQPEPTILISPTTSSIRWV